MAKKHRPTNIKTKRGMLAFLEENDNEMPFVEEAWLVAVEEAEKVNTSIRHKNLTTGMKKRLIAPGNLYFDLLETPRYREMAQRLLRQREGIPEPEEKRASVCTKELLASCAPHERVFLEKFIAQYFNELDDEETLAYIIARIQAYYGEYELNGASDEYLVMSAISDEVVIRELNRQRLSGGLDVAKQMRSARSDYMDALEGLSALKKFNLENKGKESLFSLWVKKLTEEGKLQEEVSLAPDDIDILLKAQRTSLEEASHG